MIKKALGIGLIAFTLLGISGCNNDITIDKTNGLNLCITEDSNDCYWDANIQGNGKGKSFTVIDNVVHYW